MPLTHHAPSFSSQLESLKANSYLPLADHELPVMAWSEFQQRVKTGERLLVVSEYVLSVHDWMDEHPGGAAILAHYVGKVVNSSTLHALNSCRTRQMNSTAAYTSILRPPFLRLSCNEWQRFAETRVALHPLLRMPRIVHLG